LAGPKWDYAPGKPVPGRTGAAKGIRIPVDRHAAALAGRYRLMGSSHRHRLIREFSMKAIRFPEPKKVEIVEIAEPRLNPEDVLVEVRYAGLCGSDLSVYRGLFPLVTYPRIAGHEISGVVVG